MNYTNFIDEKSETNENQLQLDFSSYLQQPNSYKFHRIVKIQKPRLLNVPVEMSFVLTAITS